MAHTDAPLADLARIFSQRFSEDRCLQIASSLTFTTLLLMLTIDHAFNNIWRVSRPRPLLQRILVYWTALPEWRERA